MKILMINAVCGITSTGRICTDVADLLTEQGHECRIAYGRGKVPDKYLKYAVKIGSDIDTKIHGLSTRVFDNTGFCSVGATKRFIKWIKDYDPDIIHLHNIHGYYINIELLFGFLKEYNKPVLWTLHDCWAYTGHCAHYTFCGCDRWLDGCFACPQKKTYPASFVFDRSKLNYINKKRIFTGVNNLTVITPSQWLKGEVEKSFLKEYEVKAINNGIDLNIFKPFQSDFKSKYGINDKKIVLGVANVWSKRKGVVDIIQLSDKLDDSYKIVIVGDLRNEVVPEKILHIAHTNSPEELAQIYTAADVFVNPTYEDNFPTTNLESMACGTPVITYKTGGSPEAIDKNCGAVVECGNVDAIIAAIQDLMTNGNECINASLNYDKKLCFQQYINLYKEMLK